MFSSFLIQYYWNQYTTPRRNCAPDLKLLFRDVNKMNTSIYHNTKAPWETLIDAVCINPDTLQRGIRSSSSPESAVDNLEVSQTASTSGAPSLGLCTPVVYKTNTSITELSLPVKSNPQTQDDNFYFSYKPQSLFQTQSEDIRTKYGILTLSLALLRVSTLATWGLLEVVSLGPTTTAQGVRLVPALTKRWCSLGLMRQTEQVKNVQKCWSKLYVVLPSCLSTEAWITVIHMFRHLCLRTSQTRLERLSTLEARCQLCNDRSAISQCTAFVKERTI